MKIKSINHDIETNTVTIFEENKARPTICLALGATYDERGHLTHIVLDRVISGDWEEGLWHILTAFTTEIARSDSIHLFSKNQPVI